MREIKIKINNQLKIEELNNIRKKFKLPQIDYTKGITLKEVICYIQQVKESIKNHINRADYIHNKERLIELLDYENTGIEWQMKYISYILESIQYYEEIYAELEDIILTKLLLKNESSIDTYFYNRGWIFSNRISAKDILSYIGSINKYKLKKLNVKFLNENMP